MPKETPKRKFPRKLLIYLSIVLLTVSGLLAGLVLLLPWVVSSYWFKELAEKQVTKAIYRPIQLDVLRWQWPGSIQIEGLRIADDPAFSKHPLLTLKTLSLAVNPFELLNRTLTVDCKVTGLEIELIRHQNGRTNWASLLQQFRTIEPENQKTAGGTQFPAVPVDLKGRVQLSQINIRVDDRLNGKRLRFRNATVDLDFPALFSAPVRLNIKSELDIDGNEVPPFQLTVTGENFFNSAGDLDLNNAGLDLDGNLPGAQISLRGHPVSEEVDGRVTIDLARLTTILKPLLPPDFADTNFSGELQLQMSARGHPQQTIDFTTRLEGRQLGISGELVQNKKIVPFDFKSTHTGQVRPKEKEIAIRSGELQILKNSRLHWNGTVKKTGAAPAAVDLRLIKLSFDLKELFEALKAMVPQGLSLHLDTLKPALLEIAGADYSGMPGSGAGAVKIKDISLTIPSFSLAAKEHGLSAAGRHLAVSIQDLNLALENHFPARVSLQISAAADSLDLDQMSRLHVESFKMPQLNLRVENLPVPGRPGSGKLQLEGVLQIDRLQLKAEQDLWLIQLDIPQFKLEAEQIGESLKAIPEKMNVTAAIKVGKLQTIGDTSLSIENLEISQLKLRNTMNRPGDDARPGRAELSASLRLDHLEVADEPAIELHKLNIPSLNLVATDFHSSENFMPQQVELNSAINLQSLTVKGNPNLQIAQLEIPRFTVKADAIKKSGQAPFGIVARLSVNESLALGKFHLPGLATLENIQQSIAAEVVLAPEAEAIVALNDFTLTVSDLQITKQPYGSLQTSLNVGARAAALKIESLQPLTVDLDGLKARAEVGKIIKVAFEAGAKNSGWSSINSKGTAVIDLAQLSAIAKNFLKPFARYLKLAGQAELDWNLSGRRPREGELKRLATPTTLRPDKDLGFLNKVDISGRLKNVGIDMRLKDGRRLKIGNVSSTPSIDYRFNPQSGSGQFDVHIALKQIYDLPPLGHLPKPLRVNFTLAGEHHYLDRVSLTQALDIKTYGLKQNARVSLFGIDRLLKKGRKTPLSIWLQKIGATVNADLTVEDTQDLAFLPPNLEVSGGLKLGVQLRLKPGQQITVKTSAQSRQMNFQVADAIAVKGLKLDLDLMKDIQILDQAAAGVKRGASYLSDEVLQPGILTPSATTPAKAAVEQFLGETHKRQRSRHTLSFESAQFNRLGLPLKITHAILDFYLKKGLPALDYVQVDLLGGTLIGSLSFLKHVKDIYIQSRLQFSGLNAFNLVPNAGSVGGVPDDREGEISGQVSIVLPLTTKLESILQKVQAHIMFSHIGSQSLARLLYALDPYESNEAIVSQRRLLQTGSPRWIKMTIRNGNLALEGEVAVKGIRVELPRLTRFNIGNLSGLQQFNGQLLQLQPLIQALAILAADHMVVAKEGQVHFGN